MDDEEEPSPLLRLFILASDKARKELIAEADSLNLLDSIKAKAVEDCKVRVRNLLADNSTLLRMTHL